METPMEGLIQTHRMEKAEGRDWHDIKKIPQSRGNAAKQLDLLNQDYVWDLMKFFDSAGSYYWIALMLKFTTFYNTMFSSYGGVRLFNSQSSYTWSTFNML